VPDSTTLLFRLPAVGVERAERCADKTRVVYVVTAEETDLGHFSAYGDC
jgi:hypothetical protein